MKKMFSELYKEDQHLTKFWWYRLVRVLAFGFLGLIMIIAMVALMADAPTELLGKHNIKIRSTLNEYTQNYAGNDYDNTIPKFFEQKGSFGVLNEGKLMYVSGYSLGESICVKSPGKYLDGIAQYIYKKLPVDKQVGYTIEDAKKALEENLKTIPDRKCYFNVTRSESEFNDIKLLGDKVINYRPNFIFYIEMFLLVTASAFVLFTLASLIYWGPIRYVIYGKNR